MMRFVWAIAAVCAGIRVADAQTVRASSGEAAEALRAIAQARDWRKVRVSCRRSYPAGWSGWRYFAATAAGSDVLLSDDGDEEGVVRRDSEGRPQYLGAEPVHSLRSDDQFWVFIPGNVYADLFTDQPGDGRFDPRALGLTARSYSSSALHEELGLSGTRPVRFQKFRRDGLEVVRAEFADGGATEWHLAPEQGGLPIAVRREIQGRIVAECSSELHEFDGMWYPARVTYYGEGGRAGGDVREIVEVLSLEREPADVPDRLTPEYIGIDAGMNICLRRGSQPVPELRKWDGQQALTLEQYQDAWSAGQVREGPNFLANLERARAMEVLEAVEAVLAAEKADAQGGQPAGPGHARATTQSLLERLTGQEAYTSEFIRRYRLDAEQTQRAILVLRDCQALGWAHLARVSDQVKGWSDARKTLTFTRPTTQGNAEIDRLHRQIFGRLEEIFTTRLYPRLEAIPTRAQRQAVQEP